MIVSDLMQVGGMGRYDFHILLQIGSNFIGVRVHNVSTLFTNGNVKPTLDLPVYLKPPSPYKYINNTNVAYSQAKQDQTVYHLFPKKNGFFIEMGAFDGMSLSNTLRLERHHNWTGLLIEANPDLCDAIDKRKK